MQPEHFEALYARHAQPLYGFLAYRTGDDALAEDLLADVFERVLRARRPFDPRRGSESAWLYTIALNLLRDHGRRQTRGALVLEQEAREQRPHQADEAEAVGRRDELRSALGTLSDEEREVVALRFGADLTVPEIARVTKEALTTVEGRLYRALRKLRIALGEGG